MSAYLSAGAAPERPRVTTAIELDVRAPVVSPSTASPVAVQATASLPPVAYALNRATAYAEVSVGTGAEVSIGRCAEGDGTVTLLLDLGARGLRVAGTADTGASFELDDPANIRTLAAALLGALVEAERVGIVAPAAAGEPPEVAVPVLTPERVWVATRPYPALGLQPGDVVTYDAESVGHSWWGSREIALDGARAEALRTLGVLRPADHAVPAEIATRHPRDAACDAPVVDVDVQPTPVSAPAPPTEPAGA